MDALAAMTSPLAQILDVLQPKFTSNSGLEYGEIVTVWEALCRFGSVLEAPVFETLEVSCLIDVKAAAEWSTGTGCRN